MEQLSNGAYVIDKRDGIVLAKRNNEFITWRVDENGACYLGHYFANFFNASNDYANRVKHEGK